MQIRGISSGALIGWVGIALPGCKSQAFLGLRTPKYIYVGISSSDAFFSCVEKMHTRASFGFWLSILIPTIVKKFIVGYPISDWIQILIIYEARSVCVDDRR